jgi:hypothetical protein
MTDQPVEAAAAEDADSGEEQEWVATEAIYHGFALAYQPGDPVHAANVALNGYDEQGVVAKRNTKAGRAALARAAADPADPRRA